MPFRPSRSYDPLRTFYQLAQLRQMSASNQASSQQQTDNLAIKFAAASGPMSDAEFAAEIANYPISQRAGPIVNLSRKQAKENAKAAKQAQAQKTERGFGITGESGKPGGLAQLGAGARTSQQKQEFGQALLPLLQQTEGPERAAALQRLGAQMNVARAAQRQPQTELERMIEDVASTPDEARLYKQRVLQKRMLGEPGSFIQLPDGTIMSTGRAALNVQQRQEVERYIDSTSAASDLRQIISLVEENPHLVGGYGLLGRGTARLGSVASDALPGPFSNGIRRFSSEAYLSLRGDPSVDEDVRNMAASFAADPATLGTIEAFDFFLAYKLARNVKSGRTTNKDVSRAEKLISIKDLNAGSSLIVPRLRNALSQLERQSKISEMIIKREGSGVNLIEGVQSIIPQQSTGGAQRRRFYFNEAGELVERK